MDILRKNDGLDDDRDLIESIIVGHTKIPYSYGKIDALTIFDRRSDNYLLMVCGWMREELTGRMTRRVHGTVIHVSLVGDRIWLQADGTEEGVFYQLVAGGIAEERIVIGWHSEETRARLAEWELELGG